MVSVQLKRMEVIFFNFSAIGFTYINWDTVPTKESDQKTFTTCYNEFYNTILITLTQ